MADEIEFWRSGEWTMVYLNGQLVMSGDHYHANEWLQERVGVVIVDDEAGVCIPDGRNALQTLEEVSEAQRARDERLRLAFEKREAARKLLAEADEIDGTAGVR